MPNYAAMDLISHLLLYQQVYDIFQHVVSSADNPGEGPYGMPTAQNGVAAYSKSHVSHIC